MTQGMATQFGEWLAFLRYRLWHNVLLLRSGEARSGELAHLEGAMGGVIPSVHPSSGFRDQLRQRLALAAQQKASGVSVERQASWPLGLVLGISAGILATTLTLLLVLLRFRWAGAKQ